METARAWGRTHVRLERLAALVTAREEDREARRTAERGPVRVVLADDSERFRDGMRRAFERTSAVDLLAVVSDGRAAVESAIALRPNVVVVDHRMPGLSGLEVAEMLGQQPHAPAIRVVVLSAHVDAHLETRAQAAGATACVDKAESRRDIVAAILKAAQG